MHATAPKTLVLSGIRDGNRIDPGHLDAVDKMD